MDEKLLRALEKVQKNLAEKHYHPEPVKSDDFLFDIPKDIIKPHQPEPKSSRRPLKNPLDVIESIISKPPIDMEKVNDELMKKMESSDVSKIIEPPSNAFGLV